MQEVAGLNLEMGKNEESRRRESNPQPAVYKTAVRVSGATCDTPFKPDLTAEQGTESPISADYPTFTSAVSVDFSVDAQVSGAAVNAKGIFLQQKDPTRTDRPGIIYISGPMTGHPNYNRDKFHEVAAELRAQGFRVLNPADIPERADWRWRDYCN